MAYDADLDETVEEVGSVPLGESGYRLVVRIMQYDGGQMKVNVVKASRKGESTNLGRLWPESAQELSNLLALAVKRIAILEGETVEEDDEVPFDSEEVG